MTTFSDHVLDRIAEANNAALTPQEKAVLDILVHCWTQSLWVQQREIARSAPWLGCHPEHEGDVVKNKMESTLRQVRQIVRDLRLKYRLPVISGRNGYKIAEFEAEAREYLSDLEREARAQARAWFETYDAMRESVDMTSSFFESMRLYETDTEGSAVAAR